MKQRSEIALVGAACVAAVLLAMLPMPVVLEAWRPFWLGLVLIYFALEAPGSIGLGAAFLIGCAADLLVGTLLGEQALRLVVLVFLVLRWRPRLRFQSVWLQSLTVLALFANDALLVWVIRSVEAAVVPAVDSVLAAVVAMLLWPWLFLLLDDLRARLRRRAAARPR